MLYFGLRIFVLSNLYIGTWRILLYYDIDPQCIYGGYGRSITLIHCVHIIMLHDYTWIHNVFFHGHDCIVE